MNEITMSLNLQVNDNDIKGRDGVYNIPEVHISNKGTVEQAEVLI